MGNWDGIPAELHPDKQDVGLLEAILMKVIEAHAINHDFDHVKNMLAGQRQLRYAWESDYARQGGGFFVRFPHSVAVAPAQEWNARIDMLAKHARLLARGIRSSGLKAFLLKDTFLTHADGTKVKKIESLFWIHVEEDSLLRLRRPDRLAGWFVRGRSDRLIRWLRGERPP